MGYFRTLALSALWQWTESPLLVAVVAFGAAVAMAGVVVLVRSFARSRLGNIEPRLVEVTETLRRSDLTAQERTKLTDEWADLTERRNTARSRLEA